MSPNAARLRPHKSDTVRPAKARKPEPEQALPVRDRRLTGVSSRCRLSIQKDDARGVDSTTIELSRSELRDVAGYAMACAGPVGSSKMNALTIGADKRRSTLRRLRGWRQATGAT